MKLFFDENLSHRLVSRVADLYPGSTHVRDVGLVGASDEAVWAYARDNGFILVSKDADFYQRSILHGAPPKNVWLRIGNSTTTAITDLLVERCEVVRRFTDDENATFLVLNPVKHYDEG